MSHRPDPRGRELWLVVRVVDASGHFTDPVDLGVEAIEERAKTLEARVDNWCRTHVALLPN
jgi:hypothetical protein